MSPRLLLAYALLVPTAVEASSPWVPADGTTSFSLSYVHDSFRDFHYGTNHAALRDPFNQDTGFVEINYGLGRGLSLDVETGYTRTSVGRAEVPPLADYVPRKGLHGIVDTTIGLRWRLTRTENWTVTLRGAGIIAGSYPLSHDSYFSPGDRASGGLGSVLVGRTFPKGFFAFTETGLRFRTKPVPNDFFGLAGFGKSVRKAMFLASYQTSRSFNGVDILGPGFTFPDFPATKKIFGAAEFTGTYSFRNGITAGFTYGQILHSRNAGLKHVLAPSISFNLPKRGPHF